MFALLATVIPLGLAAAVRPSLLALQLLIVGQPHWWPRARALAIGAALPLVIFGVLVFLGLNQLPTPQPGELDVLGVSIRTIIGFGFLVAAIWLIRSHPSLEERSAQFMQGKAQHASTRDFFFLGLALNGKSLTSYALLLPALHDITTFEQGVEWQILALVVLYALALSTLWVPVLLAIFIGKRGGTALVKLSDFVLRHNFTILGVMFLLVGIYLTGSAAVLVAIFERL
jgi:hypothetical protein